MPSARHARSDAKLCCAMSRSGLGGFWRFRSVPWQWDICQPHRPIDAKTMLQMGSLLSAASQNAAPTRSRTGSTGSVPPCSWSLWLTSGSLKMDAGSTTITSGPSSSSFRSMLATWLSMERRNPSSVKVQGSLVELLRFPTAFTKCCLLFTTARGKRGWENSNEGRQMNMQPNSIKKLYLNFATCTQNLSMYMYRYYTLRMYCLSESKAGTKWGEMGD